MTMVIRFCAPQQLFQQFKKILTMNIAPTSACSFMLAQGFQRAHFNTNVLLATVYKFMAMATKHADISNV
jgi:hypothetical protein